MDSQSHVLERLRTAFRSGITLPEEFRRTQLTNLLSMVRDNEGQILKALHQDLAKPKFESILSEVDIVVNELHYAISNFRNWMKPEYVAKSLATKLDECFVRREPLGVVLIIGPWNYPLQLLIVPLVGAIAAGNCAVIKPSEISSATDRLVAELIPKYLSQDCYAVVRGGSEQTKALLQNRFDHIFYTGSQAVARSVVQAASVYLTPVTLELGGKCPCLIYGRINIQAAAHRLVWAKFFNAGQSCVAPDYVLCTEATRDALLPALSSVLEQFYGKEPQKCPDLSRIVSARHFTRLMKLLEQTKGKVVIGGESDQEDKYIAPTVVVDAGEDDALMAEEIFGPILPIFTVEELEKSIEFVNRHEKPLALYVFSDESSVVKTVMEKTSSGGFCSNDGIVHMTLPGLPFGGVGASGWGSYHGRWSFETFSHRRACLIRGWGLERLNTLRYPPYTEDKLKWLRWTTSQQSSCSLM
ncbi:aldehyde dehydrogenase family 3 member B1-like isoform X1 [Girardinichthys multiradiatus]|uniref:aldehyde dehydrogenase family 3 member B1-like isoform X1 n=2 Tax=Girardinichthys multiradiatus TaxID=208333 RepID=UPI001FAD2E9B|nr:aldehyde dehydrogenase family 3 member B1-like isoform X1 [Girardinichthys multiradiatus]XP_047212079.1 aldehyde dehydrogenase family 3 member B1-like isoform X1 [Girardinichthys multiradiatus]XP_047212080.1 aldehyde dehydrogenase family 3 member B1-like isoform X1 [Girardinichthys multiradiatus]